MSYRTMYKNYGLTPKHITAHIDNYKIDTDPSTARGRDNLQIINQADIFYFNGGDQSRHIRTWLNDDGTPNQLLAVIKKRAFNDEVVLSGTSAGSMIWGNMTFGSGCSFGAWYFHNSVGLAPKKITDGAVNGSGLADIRNGTKSLQYEDNLGKMPAFGFINFTVDTHFNARGRLGRIVPVLMDLKEGFGMGVDENTSLFY
jgi:cyanophycinase